MKTNEDLLSDIKKIELFSKNKKRKGDCGFFVGEDLVCQRCGVPWASHS